MKIVFFEVESWEADAFRGLEDGNSTAFESGRLSLDTVAKYADADVISTFIYSDLSREVLERFKNLRLIATRSTGVDHIDLRYCGEQGIAVSNVPAYGSHAVPEHVFGLLLRLTHRLIDVVDPDTKKRLDAGWSARF